MSNLGARIREKRKREGLSLREAGEASGVAFSTLGRIENGRETTLKIAQRIEAWLSGESLILPPPPMTLRDYFAAQALSWRTNESMSPEDVAYECYAYADALMTERTKAQPNPGGVSL